MRRSLAFAAVAVAVAVAVAPAGAAHAADASPRQAWTRTGAVPTFVPEAGRVYVVADVGQESARAFVSAARSVRLKEAAGGAVGAADAAISACPLAQPLAGSGEVAASSAPAADCTSPTRLRRAADGTWRVAITPWPRFGVALVPVASATATFHLAFDVAKTKLIGATAHAPRAGEVSPEQTRLPAANSGSEEVAARDPAVLPDSAALTVTESPQVQQVAAPAPALEPQLRLASPVRSTVAAPRGPAHAASPPAWAVLSVVAALALLALLVANRRSGGSGDHIAPATTARTVGGRPIGLVAAAGAFVVLPSLLAEATVYKLGLVLIVVVGAIGLHLLVNWAGELSLAHAALVGLPAFVAAKLSADHNVSPLLLLPVAAAVGLIAGAVVGLPAIRARGIQVALVTLAAGVAIDRFFFTKTWLVGDGGGAHVSVPRLGPFTFATARSLYPVLALLVVVTIAGTWAFYRSKLGRGLLWVKAQPDAAAAFGIPVARYRTMAYAVAGAFAGFSGGLTAVWVQRLTPQAFPLSRSFTYLIIVALAGRGFVGGVAAAAVIIEGGRLFLPNADALFTYGAPIGLILTLTQHQAGLNGMGRQLVTLVKERTMQRTLRPLTIAGGVLVAVGLAAIGLAWYHAGNTSQVWVQNQELISGGIGGLALVVVGIGMVLVDALPARHRAADAERWERLLESLEADRPARPQRVA